MTTRADIYAAIKNADAAGDSASVRKLGAYLATMPPDASALTDAQKAEAAGVAAKQNAAIAAAGQPPSVAGALGDALSGGADVGSTLLSGAVAAPLAGLAGMAQGVKNIVAPDPTNMSAADRVAQVQQAATWKPRTDVGKEAVENIGKAVNAPGTAVAKLTGSDTAGDLTNLGVQAATAFAAPEIRGAFGAVARGGAESAATAASSAAAALKAKSYAGSVGLDWDSLGAAVQKKLTDVAASAGDFSSLNPDAIAREARLSSMNPPVPATSGQLAQDRVAIRNEGNVAATKAGQPIADIHIAANQALLDNLDNLKGKVSGTGATAAVATSPEQAGASVQGALRAGEAVSKAGYKAAYDAADATAGDAAVSAKPLADLLGGNPDVQHLGFLQKWLNKAGIKLDPETGEPSRPISVAELRDLKQSAGEIANVPNAGVDGFYAQKVVNAAQDAMKEHPEVKAAYDTADAQFSAHKIKYDDQAAVKDLVSNDSRTDRTTALSNTVRAVTSGAPEEIRQIKSTLLTDPDPAVRTQGRQAWREVRAQVIQQIKDRAAGGVGTVDGGAPNLTPGALNTAIKSFGPEKLDEIFGPGTTRQLNGILQAAKDVKVIPSTGGGSVGSSTVQNALAFLSKGLDTVGKVPLVGKTIVGGVQALKSLNELGGTRAAVKEATTSPLNQAVNVAKSKSGRAALGRSAGKLSTLGALYNSANTP